MESTFCSFFIKFLKIDKALKEAIQYLGLLNVRGLLAEFNVRGLLVGFKVRGLLVGFNVRGLLVAFNRRGLLVAFNRRGLPGDDVPYLWVFKIGC